MCVLLHSVLFPTQGGAISILAACERPGDFAGVVLIAPMVQMNPDSATPFKVPLICSSVLFTFALSFALFFPSLLLYSAKIPVYPELLRLFNFECCEA